MVVLGISKLRASCPVCVSMTSRRSAALLQATILSPDPLTGAIVVIPSTVPSVTSKVAIRSLAAVMVAFVHPSGTLSSHDTNRVHPAGTGSEPWPQDSEHEATGGAQCNPPG